LKQPFKNINCVISEYLELPKDITMGLPKMTFLGNIQLSIENHKGVIEYTKEKIRINTRIGELVINGNDLKIKSIYIEEIIVEGTIHRVEIEGEGG